MFIKQKSKYYMKNQFKKFALLFWCKSLVQIGELANDQK